MSPLRMTSAAINGTTAPVMGLNTSVIDSLYDLQVSRGSMAAVRGAAVAVAADKAKADGLDIGRKVPFRFADGATEPLTVAAIFNGNTVGGDASWIVGLDTMSRHVTDQYDRKLFVKFDPAAPALQSRAELLSVLAKWPNAHVQDRSGFEESIAKPIDVLLNLIYGLLALAVVISLIGIANTLALSVLDRTRELGVLRAIGMQRRQVRRAVRRESLMIAVLGTALGGLLGVGGAWGIVTSLKDKGITQFVVPAGQLALILGVACVAGLLAAAGPARRAARLKVLDAIASQ
jgi:putative ABC transport system permease protein